MGAPARERLKMATLTRSIPGPKRLESALKYAEIGWRVFPVYEIHKGKCACDAVCHSPGKHPRTVNGHNAATTSPEKIREWWKKWPRANIGMATGSGSGVWVLDIDTPKGGQESLDTNLEEITGSSIESETGGGGRHLFFRLPGRSQGQVKSTTNLNKWPGIDVRGEGGYVILPPSNHESGGDYIWEESSKPIENQLENAPEVLLRAVISRRQKIVKQAAAGEMIPEGDRNTRLTQMAGGMRRQGFEYPEILAALQQANQKRATPPLPKSEVEKIAKSVGRYEPNPSTDPDRLALNDSGNACRFADRFGNDFRYTSGEGWLHWDGARWSKHGADARAKQAAKEIQIVLREEASEVNKKGDRATTEAEREGLDKRAADIRRWARQTGHSGRIRGLLEMAESEPPIDGGNVLPDKPLLFNATNGTLDLESGELREHRREDHLTRIGGVPLTHGQPTPKWERFLLNIFKGDLELISFVQQMAGMLLSGEPTQYFFVLHGGGSNGKSTFVNVLKGVLGDYAFEVPTGLLLFESKEAAGDGTADLFGRRLVTSEELPAGRLDERGIKKITGGGTICARRLYKEPFNFAPSHTLMASSNNKPIVKDTSEGFWRRMHLVPFLAKIPEAGRISEYHKPLLREEGGGILAWMFEGWCEFVKAGKKIPACEAVTGATQEYRGSMDILGQFIEECCEVAPQGIVGASELYAAYQAWANKRGERPISQTVMGRMLRERDEYRRARVQGLRVYEGLVLRS